MKNIKMFHLNDCGYCDKARKAMKELKQEDKYKDVVVETIEETEHPDIADQYDYYATPTYYVDEKKIFEAHIGMTYEQIKDEVRHVFDLALEDQELDEFLFFIIFFVRN